MNIVCRAAAFLLFATSLCLSSSLGQEQHQHSVPGKVGEVFFPVSCTSAVQKAFNQGVALLHSFAYSEAEKVFLEVVLADPHCAMAHWGVAMSYYHQLWEPAISAENLHRGLLEIQRAKALGGTSPREQAFIDAVTVFYKEGLRVPYATRALAYQKAMGVLADLNQNDQESQIFYALALLATAPSTDRSCRNQKHAATILEPLFKQYPEHPGVAHYLIHADDNPELALQGLPMARVYAQIAPSVPHALHMPSHIFTRLGLWQDSILSNSAARTAARQHGDVGEELHAMDYLMYALLQAGRNSEAEQLLHDLQAMPDLPVDQFKIGYAAAAMPARYALERHEWVEAAGIPPMPGSAPQVLSIAYWSHAVGLARNGKPDAAMAEVEKLNQFLLQARGNDYWAAQIEIQRNEAQAWIAHARGRNEESASLLRAAASKEDSLEKNSVTPGPIVPAREQLGELLSKLRQWSEALSEFEASLAIAPGRRGALLGAAQAAEMAGDLKKADKFKQELASVVPTGTN